MGCYYLTMSVPDRPGDGMIFSSLAEVHLAYAAGKVAHARPDQGPAAEEPLPCAKSSTTRRPTAR